MLAITEKKKLCQRILFAFYKDKSNLSAKNDLQGGQEQSQKRLWIYFNNSIEIQGPELKLWKSTELEDI